MRPKGEAASSVLEVARELWPQTFRLRRLAGIGDDVEAQGPIRSYTANLTGDGWVPSAAGTILRQVDSSGREVLAVPERIDPFDPTVPDIGWCVSAPPYICDPAVVVAFLAGVVDV